MSDDIWSSLAIALESKELVFLFPLQLSSQEAAYYHIEYMLLK